MERVNRVAKNVLITAGALAALGVLMILVAPKAVHGAITTAVEVVNGPANPVVVRDFTGSATQTVSLFCPTTGFVCSQILPGNVVGPNVYQVPPGQSLVITDLEITPCSEPGVSCSFSLANGGPNFDPNKMEFFNVRTNALTQKFTYHSGLVWPAGGIPEQVGTCEGPAVLHGYLTPN